MKKFLSIILITILLSMTIPAHAGDWEFEFFGINTKDFKGRSFSKIVVGCITSFVVHEAGHLIVGDMVGMTTSMKWDNGPFAWYEWDYDNEPSDYEKSLFHVGGFLAQLIVGGTLTAIPYTRHSDFSVGFNGFASVHNTIYGITGGMNYDNTDNRHDSAGNLIVEGGSDVKNLNYYGNNGPMIAIGSGIVSGVFTYINLNKDKEK